MNNNTIIKLSLIIFEVYFNIIYINNHIKYIILNYLNNLFKRFIDNNLNI